jgi:hypothetical protein
MPGEVTATPAVLPVREMTTVVTPCEIVTAAAVTTPVVMTTEMPPTVVTTSEMAASEVPPPEVTTTEMPASKMPTTEVTSAEMPPATEVTSTKVPTSTEVVTAAMSALARLGGHGNPNKTQCEEGYDGDDRQAHCAKHDMAPGPTATLDARNACGSALNVEHVPRPSVPQLINFIGV